MENTANKGGRFKYLCNACSVFRFMEGQNADQNFRKCLKKYAILSKGQGNYETLNGQGRHIFYAFLCKCDLFTSRFDVPRLTGILVEENSER